MDPYRIIHACIAIAIVLINNILTRNEEQDDRGKVKILKYYYYLDSIIS